MTITRSALASSALGQLSDRDLLAHVRLAAQVERQATAHLIALLAELDARRLYLGEGFSSLFTYCTQALHLSEHATYNRIEAARAARRFPIVLELIEEGAVTLTTIRLLAPHLTPENHRDVLARARHNSKRDVEQLVAALNPRPDEPATIRKLPSPAAPAPTSPPTPSDAPPLAMIAATRSAAPPASELASRPPSNRPAEVKPLAPERYKVQFTVNRDTYDKLRRAQDLLRHSVPDGDPAVIFERALTLLVTELERRKVASTDRPRESRSINVTSRHIPAAVKRTVWERDGGRCAFVGGQGRCTETGFLEYHHVIPFADGGKSTAANLELRCRSHNGYEAERWFGTGEPRLMLRERRVWYGAAELVPGTSCS